MTVSVSVDLGYEFSVKAPPGEVFAVLSDVPESVSHFPDVRRLVDLGGGVYRWEMEPVGVGAAQLQTVYASTYVSNAARRTVVWTPVPDVGNARVSGSWKITARRKGGGSDVVLKLQGTVDVPVPGLTRAVVAPLVEGHFERLVDTYVANLVARFGGEV